MERVDLTGRIAHDLDLDVPRPLQVALQQDGVTTECRKRLPTRVPEKILKVLKAGYDAHSAPSPARRRLDDHWRAQQTGLRGQALDRLVAAIVAWNDRDAGAPRQGLRRRLVSQRADHLRGRTDE